MKVENTGDVLLCVECKYYSSDFWQSFHEGQRGKGFCKHPSAIKAGNRINVITGKCDKIQYFRAEQMRNYHCGEKGKLWSPKDTKKGLFKLMRVDRS